MVEEVRQSSEGLVRATVSGTTKRLSCHRSSRGGMVYHCTAGVPISSLLIDYMPRESSNCGKENCNPCTTALPVGEGVGEYSLLLPWPY